MLTAILSQQVWSVPKLPSSHPTILGVIIPLKPYKKLLLASIIPMSHNVPELPLGVLLHVDGWYVEGDSVTMVGAQKTHMEYWMDVKPRLGKVELVRHITNSLNNRKRSHKTILQLARRHHKPKMTCRQQHLVANCELHMSTIGIRVTLLCLLSLK